MNTDEIIDVSSLIDFTYTGNPTIRSGSIIYPKVSVGENFITGHNVLIRSNVSIGDKVLIGTNVVIDGNVKIGDFVKIETGSYLPPGLTIGNRVFIGPHVTFTNDRFPLKRRDEYEVAETFVGDNVSIAASATILPGVRIGDDCFIAAGAIVTKDVPNGKLVKGFGDIVALPNHLVGVNDAKSWR